MSTVVKYAESKETAAVNLFKFVNIVEPAAKMPSITTAHHFVEIPDSGSNTFLTAIDGLTTDEDIEDALGTASDSFTAYEDYKEIRELNTDLYDLNEFVSKYNKSISIEDVQSKLAGVSAYSAANQNSLWDNLFYFTINTKSRELINIIVQLLRTNKFVEEFEEFTFDPEPDEETISKYNEILSLTASADVLIPKKLVVREASFTETVKNGIDVRSKEILSRKNKADKSRDKIRILKGVIDEIETAGLKLLQDNTAAYDTALKNHEDTIESLPCNAVKPEFDFTPTDQFSEEFLGNNLSPIGKSYFDKYKKTTDTKINNVATSIKSELSGLYSTILKNTREKKGYVRFKGFLIPSEEKAAPNTYMISSEQNVETEDYSLYLTHYFDNPEMALIELEVTADDGEGGVFEETVSKPIYKSNNHVTFKLFQSGIPTPSSDYELDMQFKLEDDNYSSNENLPLFKLIHPRWGSNYSLVNSYNDTEPGNEEVKMYGVKHRGVMEYKRVEQEICCYVAGEVSHIENIMAREYKEKISRTLNRSEITQEDSTEKEVENLHDTTSVDRYEMNKEVSQVLQEENSRNTAINAGGSASFEYGSTASVNVFANTSLNFASSSATSNTFNQSESFAKEMVERALQRVVEKTSSKRISRMLREQEDTNKHGFDNRAGDKHVTGIYRWVDKIYENRLINYGKRLIYDFMVPEPSRNFKEWVTKDDSSDDQYINNAPRPLSDFEIDDVKDDLNTSGNNGVHSWKDINEENYAAAAAAYGADVEPCPTEYFNVSKSYSEIIIGHEEGGSGYAVDDQHGSFTIKQAYNYNDIEIPEGYKCLSVDYHAGSNQHGGNYAGGCAIFIGTTKITLDNNDTYKSGTFTTNNALDYNLPVSVAIRDVISFHLNVTAKCKVKNDYYQAWQQATYLKIVEAYNKRYQEYIDAENSLVTNDSGDDPVDYNYNPAIGRTIEQRELKRLCIELMLKPFGHTIGTDHYGSTQINNIYWMKRDASLDEHSKYIRFMEEAFDWEIISYYLYPYFSAANKRWKGLVNTKSSSDPLFEAFLQSGLAKVSLPVRPGYEYDVLHYMNTGKLWKESVRGQMGLVDIFLNRSIKELLHLPEGEEAIEAIWKTRIPTALTIIQKDSAGLDENGLPCFCEDGTPLAQADPEDNNVLDGTGSGDFSGDFD